MRMLVESVMTRSVVTTEPHAAACSAEALMHAGHFRHVPVVAHGRVVGMVSDRDVVGRGNQSIGEVMRAPVISVTPETPVEVAARLMADNKIGALPVLGAGAAPLLGIVSQTDLFEALARLLGGEGPSTRLEVQLVDPPRQLAQLTALAHEVGVPITSLVTLPTSGRPGRQLVVRIGTMQFGPFLAALRQAGIEVDLPQGLESPTPVVA
jgi:acetoin utilization protein AcuB